MNDGGRRLAAIRGATTVEDDTSEQILERTSELLTAMISRNGISQDDIVSIIFTATADLSADFPAAAARQLGLSRIPLLCSQEINVNGSIKHCIRVLMHVYTTRSRDQIGHSYLHEARQLRTDLPE
jgi:chorismate mutase